MSRHAESLESRFLAPANVAEISAALRRPAAADMKRWAAARGLDGEESIDFDYADALDFTNAEFVKEHISAPYELSMAGGAIDSRGRIGPQRKYPKLYIAEGVERYNVEDFRAHDAYFTQEVYRTDNHFRYRNRIKKWETGLYKRHYDHSAEGLRDTRELETPLRGYDTDGAWGPNFYESADSIMYGYAPQEARRRGGRAGQI